MADTIRISVVTPVLNSRDALERTRTALAVQAASFEHVIVDGGSTDETCRLLDELRKQDAVRVISEADRGVYDAVAKGFDGVSGDILAWINAGDVYFPWTLKVVSEVFAQFPSVDWIAGVPVTIYRSSGLAAMDPFTPVYNRFAIESGWHNGGLLPCLQQESMFWRRSLWERAGGAEVLRGNGKRGGFASDYRLWRRFARHAALHTVCCPLGAFEVAPGQITERHRAAYRRECGVAPDVLRPNRVAHLMWRFYSCLSLGRAIKVDSL